MTDEPSEESVREAKDAVDRESSALLGPVMDAGAKLHRELEAAGLTKINVPSAADRALFDAHYRLDTVRAVIKRGYGLRRTRKEKITVLVREALASGTRPAEDPLLLVHLEDGERVERLEIEEGGWDGSYWATLSMPANEELRAMANEIPLARSSLLKALKDAAAKARQGAEKLAETRDLS